MSTIQDWLKRFEETGDVEPRPRGCEQPLISDDQAQAVQAVVDQLPEATLAQYCDAWKQATGQRVSTLTICLALQRFDRPRKKKTVAAVERDETADGARDRVRRKRHATGHVQRGERAYATERRNTGHNMTLLVGITLAGMRSPFVVKGLVTTAVMETYVQHSAAYPLSRARPAPV